MVKRLHQECCEALSLRLGRLADQGPQTRLRDHVEPDIVIVQSQSFGLDLGIEPEQPEIGGNGGSGGAAEPGEFRLRVDLAGVEEGLVVEGLLEGISVFRYL